MSISLSVRTADLHSLDTPLLVLVLGSDPSERVGDIDGAEAARAFVEHVGRDRREAFTAVRIRYGSGIHLDDDADDRHRLVLDGADLKAVVELVPDDARKCEGRVRTNIREP
jgi:hypothetical protein